MEKRAFTLVEILVVATIIGLLASVGIFSYTQFSRQSRDAKRRADVELVRSAVELYRSNNNAYPTTVTVGGDICDPGGCSATSTYLKKVPNDPKSSSYTYYYTGSSSDYTIGAYLEGGGSGSCGNCGSSASVVCNYCVGPYGEK